MAKQIAVNEGINFRIKNVDIPEMLRSKDYQELPFYCDFLKPSSNYYGYNQITSVVIDDTRAE